MSFDLLPSQKETASGGGAPCQPTRGMVAAAHGSVKPANPLAEPKCTAKYDFQNIASFTTRIYSARQRATGPGEGLSAEMNHLLIGVSSALGVCVVLLVVLAVWLARRGGRRADERVTEVVRVLERRMDELAGELAGAVERAEEEGRRSRFLGEIAGSIDLDEVLARTLDAATTAIDGGDAAVIQLENQDGGPTVAAHGLSADGAEPISGCLHDLLNAHARIIPDGGGPPGLEPRRVARHVGRRVRGAPRPARAPLGQGDRVKAPAGHDHERVARVGVDGDPLPGSGLAPALKARGIER